MLRGNHAAPTVWEIDVDKIIAGEMPDFRLQPRDLIFVPERGGQTLRRLVDLALTVFVRTIAGRAGADAARAVLD